jgi:hypothetical protein
MRIKALVISCAVLTLSISAHSADGGPSRFSAKIYFRGNWYSSDDGILTGVYRAEGDSPALFDASSRMQYDFDAKLGMSINGAVCYSISRNFELDISIGYTAISMDIIQRSNYERNAYVGGGSYYSTYQYDNAAQYDYHVFSVRPGLNLFLSSGSWVVPYVGARIDVMIVSGEAEMIFAQPYLDDQAGQIHLFIGEEARLEELRIEGSQVLVGGGLESGLEFKLAATFSLYAGVSLDVHVKKGFDDFSGMIADDDMRARIDEIGYIYDGMQFTSVGVILGLKHYF